MMSLGKDEQFGCSKDEAAQTRLSQSPFSHGIFHQSSGHPCTPSVPASINIWPEVEEKLNEQEIRIDILELELDQHKETISEKIGQLNERDSTIKTQCFHIVSLHENVQRLTDEISRLNNIIYDLRYQLCRFLDEDWQNHIGAGKKRKLDL